MADVRRLTALGMSPELAVETAKQIEVAPTVAEVSAAIAAKPEVAALDDQSTAADIVAALQA